MGWIKTWRKVQESGVWDKPAWYYKVWEYILMEVKYNDKTQFKPGENFFSFNKIYLACKLHHDFNNPKRVDVCVRWLKSNGNCTTRKTTRGFILSVCNYSKYQKDDGVENDTKNDTGTTQERHRHDTITKEVISNKKETPIDIDVVLSLKSNAFKTSFQEYVRFRTEQKKSMKPMTIERLLKKLNRFPEDRAIFMLNRSIENGWVGCVYEQDERWLKEQLPKEVNKEQKDRIVEQANWAREQEAKQDANKR